MSYPTLLGYFDPGSGSILLQVVVGGFAGGFVLVRYAWDRLRLKFRPQAHPQGAPLSSPELRQS